MVINPLPLQADAQTWQDIARQQHALALEQQAQLLDKEILIAKLTAQIAQLKRSQFGPKAESFSAEQRPLFEESIAEELALNNSLMQ